MDRGAWRAEVHGITKSCDLAQSQEIISLLPKCVKALSSSNMHIF